MIQSIKNDRKQTFNQQFDGSSPFALKGMDGRLSRLALQRPNSTSLTLQRRLPNVSYQPAMIPFC